MITETHIKEVSYKRKKPQMKSIVYSSVSVTILIRKITAFYTTRQLLLLLFFIFLGVAFVNASDNSGWPSNYSAVKPPFQDITPSESYSIENGLFKESPLSNSNSRALRSLPEDWEEGENGLGLVPVGDKEVYILLAFTILYFLLLYCRKQHTKLNKQ